MQKIALCLILRPDDAESDVLNRLLTTEALYKKFTNVFITITCKKGDLKAEKVRLVAEQAKAIVSYFKWIDDFAAARNFNFSQVSEDFDWIMWLDADDIVKGSKYIENAIRKIDDNVDGIILPYLYDFNEHGECNVRHNKIRIIRNNGSFKWMGMLHEDLIETRKTASFFCKDVQVLHLTNHQRVDIAIERNYRITKKALDLDDNEPRNWLNHANASYMSGHFKEAIETFFKFIEISASDEEKQLAWLRIADIFRKNNDFEKAIESALEALRIRPWYPDAYYNLAQSFFNTQQFRHSKEMVLTGLTKIPPENTTIVWNPRDYDFNPLMLLAKVYYQLNDPHKAYEVLNGTKKQIGLIKMFPKNTELQKYADEVKRVCDSLDIVDSVCDKVEKATSKDKIQKLLDSVPDKLKSHPKICLMRNIHFVKTESSGRDLSIYCFETSEPWNPELAKTSGFGGSEEAVLNIAPRLANLGWNVTVYNNCGHEAKKYGKVWWKPHWTFNYRDKNDVVVAWRTPILYNFSVNSPKNYVWLHDVIGQNEFTNKRLNNITKIFPLSQWHRKLYPDIALDKFMVSANGINVEQFNNIRCTNCKCTELEKKIEISNTDPSSVYICDKCGMKGPEQMFAKVKRDPFKLIYTSAQDRGEELLLKLFPQIKKKVPQATLDIYYGWQTWDTVYQDDPVMQDWKKGILEMIKQPGVKDHGRITHDEIAKKYLEATVWVYPTEFTEISCITGMKAQAAGCIPVTTTVAALNETVQHGVKLDFKDIYTNKRAQKQWVDSVVYILQNPWKQEEIRESMIPWAKKKFSWDKVAQQWHQEFLKK